MRPSYASLCSVSVVVAFFFRKRNKHSCCASGIINLSMVSIVDSLLSTPHVSTNRILRCEANACFIGSGYAGSLSFFFFLLRLPPSFLASRGFTAQRSHARALPLLNLKKKRDILHPSLHHCSVLRVFKAT